MIASYGKGSDEEAAILGHLNVTLKNGQKSNEGIDHGMDVFDTSAEPEVWDVRRIKAMLTLALTYESRNELRAEDLLVML